MSRARYASPHQLALTEEIVPLDGPELIDADGPADADRAEERAVGLRLGLERDREEHVSTEPAHAAGADRDASATPAAADDNGVHQKAARAPAVADQPKEP